MIRCIYGPPASGKTTYIREHATEEDVIFEYDSIMTAVTKRAVHTEPSEEQHKTVLFLRDAFLNRVKDISSDVWFSCCRVTDSIREALGEDCEYVDLSVSKDELFRRVDEDDSRPDKEAEYQKIEKYFNEERGFDNMTNKTINEKIAEGREYRELRFDDINLNNEEYIVEGYATTFNEPYHLYSRDGYTVNEQIDARAFDGADMTDVILQVSHTGPVYARTKNGTLALSVDSRGLRIRADLSGTERGRELYEDIKGGYMSQMSIGFTVSEDDWTTDENRDTGTIDILRTIRQFKKVYDVSVVAFPANPETDIYVSREKCEGVIAKAEEEIQRREQAEAREKQKQKIRILAEVSK